MRVIAGKARRLPLKTLEGMDTRPTQDRIKETLFNMIGNDVERCRFLDLFSGSGGIGIEALSRGAEICYFVENSRKAMDIIKGNLAFTQLMEDAVCMECDALTALRRLEDAGAGPFDYIFMDPPYEKGLEEECIRALKGSRLVDEYTTIIVEEKLEHDFSFAEDLGFRIKKEKCYKTNKHVFITLEEN